MITTMIVILLALQFSLCSGQSIHRESGKGTTRMTVFPQIHTNLRGMVREFVRSMYQDTKGNIWFGTNTDGIIRFDGTKLEEISLGADKQSVSVREIVEDNAGNVWFGTSSGLVKYDGMTFTTFSTEVGLQHEEIWGLAVDASGMIWVGTINGVSQFDGATFTPFVLPTSMVDDPRHMVSSKLDFHRWQRHLQIQQGSVHAPDKRERAYRQQRSRSLRRQAWKRLDRDVLRRREQV